MLHLTIQSRFLNLARKSAPKYVSADEAVSHIQSNNRLYVHSIAASPNTILNALENRYRELKNVELCHLHLLSPNPCSKPEYKDSFFVNNFFIGANQRKQVAQGISSYVPVFLHEVPKLLRDGFMTPDCSLLNVSTPDKHGFCSLGVEVCAALPAAQASKLLIAQINPNMPRTHGSGFIHINAFDYVVEVNDSIPIYETKPPTPVESEIGKVIAGLVQDGATLQLGIGSIPNAVLSELKHHKNLGIHTEMFSEGVIDLYECGVITNLEKKFMPGKILTSFIMGSKRLYDFVDDNCAVAFLDASITNDPKIIGSNLNVTAINSAIEIDLSGQVCADSIGTHMISGVGGQVDFERGAAISKGGFPIICLPSCTKNGESRIVPTLKEGAGVITSRYHVHYIVTEYGYAYLFGKNMIERARALIKISHPKHRDALTKQAFEILNVKL